MIIGRNVHDEMKREFVTTSFHSLQPRLAEGVDRAVNLRRIPIWESLLGISIERELGIDLENLCGCGACLLFPPG